jgi:hypothetical protein
MRKLFLLSAFILLNVTTYSCTTDDETSDKSATEVKKEINPSTPSYADDPDIGGGQSGQTPIPPPKP